MKLSDLFKRLQGISIAIIFVYVMFKIMHWPYQLALILSGSTLLTVSYLGTYIVDKKKTIYSHIKVPLLLITVTNFVLVQLHYPRGILELIGAPAFWLFLGIGIFERYFQPATSKVPKFRHQDILDQEDEDIFENQEKKSNQRVRYSPLLTGVASVLVLTGVVFKLMSFPGATILLISGLIFLGITFSSSYRK